MPKIELTANIIASKEIVFDLFRNVDLHKISTEQAREKAITGVTSGLIGLRESVIRKTNHFGVYQKLTSRVTEFDRPFFFVDEMVGGAFKPFRCEHHFSAQKW